MNVRYLISLPRYSRRTLKALPCLLLVVILDPSAALVRPYSPWISNLKPVPVLLCHMPCFISITCCFPPCFLIHILLLAHPKSFLAPGATGSSSAIPLQQILSSTFGPGRSLSSTFSCTRSLLVSVLSCEFSSQGGCSYVSRQVARFASPSSSTSASFGMGPRFPPSRPFDPCPRKLENPCAALTRRRMKK